MLLVIHYYYDSSFRLRRAARYEEHLALLDFSYTNAHISRARDFENNGILDVVCELRLIRALLLCSFCLWLKLEKRDVLNKTLREKQQQQQKQ